jgi:hypothetical protein
MEISLCPSSCIKAGRLANALGVEKVIGPRDFLLVVVDQAIRTSAGWGGGFTNEQLPLTLESTER